MDREQEELQFFGFFFVFKESFKIIFSWRKIFSQITLAFILPLSFIFLAHIQISELLFIKILKNEEALHYTPEDTQTYDHLSNIISYEKIDFWLFKVVYFTYFLILSLLSTSAVVYTIACIYTDKEITFKKVISIVPKVWKRLMVTFIWSFAFVLVYNIIFAAMFIFWVVFMRQIGIKILILIGICILYFVGFVYISIIWHLAGVISVLEDKYGIQAMIMSRALIKGNMKIAVAVFFLLTVLLIGIELAFELVVVPGGSRHVGLRIAVGILCFLILFKVFLFGLVVQTIIYFVCKSYHHENIDKGSLADHLEVYLGEYVPLNAKDVQLEAFHEC